MSIDIVSILMSHAQDHNVSIRADYSGRGMFGKRCVGITGSFSECNRVVQAVIHELIETLFDRTVDAPDCKDDAYDYHDHTQEAVSRLLEYSTDSMGLDMIMYWPKLQATEEQEREMVENEDDRY